jgi:hypothetical protein
MACSRAAIFLHLRRVVVDATVLEGTASPEAALKRAIVEILSRGPGHSARAPGMPESESEGAQRTPAMRAASAVGRATWNHEALACALGRVPSPRGP